MTYNQLNFIINIRGDGLTLKKWDAIAKRLEKAAKGRSKYREVTVGPRRIGAPIEST